MERGVVCEVTPTELVIEGDALLNIQRTYRGISVITPLSIRRGAGGEAGWVLDVLLYLHSDDTNVTHITTKNNEDIYINFNDSAQSVDFSNKLKAAFRQQTKHK